LEDFARNHHGSLDAQFGKLKVDLQSSHEASQFGRLFEQSRRRLDLSIKLSWKPSRADLETLFRIVAGTGVVFLEVDGVAGGAQTSLLKANKEMFAAFMHSPLQLFMLLNYPQPDEQCMYLSMGMDYVYQLNTDQPVSPHPLASWNVLRRDLHECLRRIPYQPDHFLKINFFLRLSASQVVQDHALLGIKAISVNRSHPPSGSSPAFSDHIQIYGRPKDCDSAPGSRAQMWRLD